MQQSPLTSTIPLMNPFSLRVLHPSYQLTPSHQRLLLSRIQDGSLVIDLDPQGIPRLRVSPHLGHLDPDLTHEEDRDGEE